LIRPSLSPPNHSVTSDAGVYTYWKFVLFYSIRIWVRIPAGSRDILFLNVQICSRAQPVTISPPTILLLPMQGCTLIGNLYYFIRFEFGFESLLGRQIFFSSTSRCVLWPNQSPVRCSLQPLSEGIKREWLEAEHLPASSIEISIDFRGFRLTQFYFNSCLLFFKLSATCFGLRPSSSGNLI
jgi:hypothetical protein